MKRISITDSTITLQREITPCDNCEATGKREVGVSCSLMYKPVRGLNGKSGKNHCPHCDAANRHKHTSIGTQIEDCWRCGGKKERIEDISFASLNAAGVQNELKFYFGWQKIESAERKMQAMFGVNTASSCTDYGRFFKLIQHKLPEVKTYGDLYALDFITAESAGVFAELFKYIQDDCMKHASITDLLVERRSGGSEGEPFEIHRQILIEVDPNGYRLIAKKRQ